MCTSRNWAQYRRNVMPFFTPANLEDEYYKDVLETIGFRVARCERSDVQLQFLNDQSLLRELLSIAVVILKIPEDKMTQFKEESLVDFRFFKSGSAFESICHTVPKFQETEMAQARDPNEQLLEPVREFIERCITELDWEDLSDHTVMDIGCGDNFLCIRALLEEFPRIGCLLATDKFPILTEEIMEDEFFVEYFRKAILQFHLVDIVDSSSLGHYRNIVNKIVCRNVLQQIANKEFAIRNMYHLLRPGGHVGILFCIANPVGTWQQRMCTSRNWAQYRKNTLNFFIAGNFGDGYYKKVMEDIGFRVILCERSDVKLQFSNDQDLLEELLIYATALLNIPEDMMAVFKEESVKIFKELIGYSGSGPLRYQASELLLIAIKP
ncbi:jhamt [Trichonephila clavata]|uniref:Jhamt n=1 Tax=Trichonephila clavata TaxID=2740835 RepID=A0A8X6M1L8_TRICU|nr:jhamt [Trichonephila clavata]